MPCKDKAKRAAYQKQYYQDNKEKLAEHQKQWRQYNKEYIREYRLNNKEKQAAQMKLYRLNNKEKIKEIRSRDYQKNKIQYKARAIKRRLMKRGAILPSSCLKAIKLFYDESEEITNILGIKMHVDHIRPISKGGAHHQDNLQVLTWCENLSKGSSWNGVSGIGIDGR